MQPADPPTRSVATVPTRAPGPYFRLPRASSVTGIRSALHHRGSLSPRGPFCQGGGVGVLHSHAHHFFFQDTWRRVQKQGRRPHCLIPNERSTFGRTPNEPSHLRQSPTRRPSTVMVAVVGSLAGGCFRGRRLGRRNIWRRRRRDFFRDGFFFLCIGF